MNNRPAASIMSSDTMETPARRLQHRYKSPPVLRVHTSDGQTSGTGAIPSSSSSMPYFGPSFCKVCPDPGHLTQKCALLAPSSLTQLDIICSNNMAKLTGEKTLQNSHRREYDRFGRFHGYRRGTSSTLVKKTEVSQAQEHSASGRRN